MGLLVDGTVLSWEDIQCISERVRYRGALQFLHQYNKYKSRDGDPFLWGDEIEYMLVKFDHKSKKAVVNLKCSDVLRKLCETVNNDVQAGWHPESAKYMIEGIPGRPYGSTGINDSISAIETNMKLRRKALVNAMGEHEHVLTIPAFPRLGCGVFASHATTPILNGEDHMTVFPMDELTATDSPKFISGIKSIRDRRGEKLAIRLPVFRDKCTPSPFYDNMLQDNNKQETIPDCINMDHTIYGIGCCSIQVTFQARNLDEAKLLYDQLIPFTPIMLALSAAIPIWKGYISDYDTRWPAFVQSVDDRTRTERKIKYGDPRYRPTRAGSVDCYLSCTRHNDKVLSYDEKIYSKLVSEGVDELLARHISHQFINNPVFLPEECLDQDDWSGKDIFEIINSTNWRSLRLKLPEHDIGWRVEFRPMEVQLTDFENAAYVVFITFLSRAILEFGLDFTLPLSKVDYNLDTASRRNAAVEEKFYFEKDVTQSCSCSKNKQSCSDVSEADECVLMTMSEIMHGKGKYRGILHYIHKYLDHNKDFNEEGKRAVKQYINLISDRATGKEKTRAKWIRDFVENHPAYKQNSIVSDEINYDLLVKCAKLSESCL